MSTTPSKSPVGKNLGQHTSEMMSCVPNSTKMMVLAILCLQNSLFTCVRRYSQGVLKETYSKHEVLLLGEVIKIVFSAYMISTTLPKNESFVKFLLYLVKKSGKMLLLALLYGSMNILSFIALRYISASTFVILAQCKILTTAACSALMLKRKYSWARWRALILLMLGVLLFSSPIWDQTGTMTTPEAAATPSSVGEGGSATKTTSRVMSLIGVCAVLLEVTLSGFSSIYFEKVIKVDPEQLGIWERNFQLALASLPVYVIFILMNGGGEAGYLGGWSPVAFALAGLGALGGLLVALSIKHGDSILKTLAVTGGIVLSSVLDHYLLGGPLTVIMIIAAAQVILAICNYTFDATPVEEEKATCPSKSFMTKQDAEEMADLNSLEADRKCTATSV